MQGMSPIGAPGAAMFHLFTHAFFKALLFLGAGSVIHAMHHEQDMRFYGGLRKQIPYTYWAMLAGTLAITGVGIVDVFGFAGFYSKDSILEAAYASASESGMVGFWAGITAARSKHVKQETTMQRRSFMKKAAAGAAVATIAAPVIDAAPRVRSQLQIHRADAIELVLVQLFEIHEHVVRAR